MGVNSSKDAISENVDLSHFKLLRCIGRGSFGKVRMVEHRASKQLFAIKYFSKEDLTARQMAKNIIKERNLLESIKHPYICNLRFAFQDDYNAYMVLDLMLGGDLRFHLQRRKFVEKELRFIVAEIVNALGYLHTMGIVHRDLKPDNILFDEKGHAHITDFNIATQMEPNSKLKSVSGTSQYMAPEILRGKGYDYSIDWWSLGVLLYECVYGKAPFHDHIKKTKRREVILEASIDYDKPTHFEPSISLFSILQGLLVKNPKERLGNERGQQAHEKVQLHPFFVDIDWRLLEQKQMPPPFIPNSQKSNFDLTYDLEEMLLEDCPLESIPIKRTKDISKLSGDMLLLENQFGNFDFLANALKLSTTSTNDDAISNASEDPKELDMVPDLSSRSKSRDNVDALTLDSKPTKFTSADLQSKMARRRSKSFNYIANKSKPPISGNNRMEHSIIPELRRTKTNHNHNSDLNNSNVNPTPTATMNANKYQRSPFSHSATSSKQSLPPIPDEVLELLNSSNDGSYKLRSSVTHSSSLEPETRRQPQNTFIAS